MSPEEFGSYTVYERLGTGGMASVHRAQLRGTDEPIALKRLRPELSLMPEFVQAFLDEARLVRELHHPNIAATYDCGRVDDTYFIAMELVRGPTLAQLANRGLPIAITLQLIAQLCDALDYAHPLGIIHRDVTPSNVIVSASTGLAKLIDFGIAKGATSEVRTKTGFIKGKFAYVAPEYTRGKIDARVDLWAAGVIAHELLTGRRLFQVDNDMETLKRVQTLPIEPPSRWNPKVPPQLDQVVMTSLARDPDRRWQRASAMRAAFVAVAQRLPTPEQIAQWIAEALQPVQPSDTSAISIEIGLIEQTITKGAPAIGGHMLAGAAARKRTRAILLLALLALAIAAVTFAIARA